MKPHTNRKVCLLSLEGKRGTLGMRNNEVAVLVLHRDDKMHLANWDNVNWSVVIAKQLCRMYIHMAQGELYSKSEAEGTGSVGMAYTESRISAAIWRHTKGQHQN